MGTAGFSNQQAHGDPGERLAGTDLALLEKLFNTLPADPFFIKDSRLRYVAANDAMVRLCGVTDKAALIGRTARDFFPQRLSRRYEALDRHVLTSGKALENNLDLSIEAGSQPVWLLFARVPVHDGQGEVVGVASASRRLPQPNRHHAKYVRLKGVARTIAEKFDAPLDLKGIAADIGRSVSQLERDFRDIFAMTPQTMHQRVRMEHALELLEGELSIADIAYACGYSDHSAFSRRFKAMVGMSPIQWRAHISA